MITNRVIKNTAWLTISEIIGRSLRIVLIFYSARVLGAAEWGISSYLLSWAALFTIATDLGLSAIVTRELVRDHNRHAENLSTFLFIKTALLFIAISIILIAVPHISALPLSQTLMVSLAFLVFFDSLRIIPSTVNKARETMHYEAEINIFTQAAILVIGMIFLLKNPSAETLNIAYAVGSGLGTLYGFYLIRDYLSGIMSSFSRPLVRTLLADSLPIAVLGLLGSLMLNTDIVMLGFMRTAEEIGYYSATQKIIFTLYVLPTLIASATFPTMTRLIGNASAFKEFFDKTLKSALMIAIPVTVGGIITAQPVIELFYGAEYIPATWPYIILLLTVPITFATSIINNALIAYNNQKYFIIYASIGLTCNVILNFMLIPLWGIRGVAIATLITQTISGIFIWQKINKLSGFTVPHGLGKTYIACGVMAALLIAANTFGVHIIISIFGAIFCYIAMLFISREPACITLTKTNK